MKLQEIENDNEDKKLQEEDLDDDEDYDDDEYYEDDDEFDDDDYEDEEEDDLDDEYDDDDEDKVTNAHQFSTLKYVYMKALIHHSIDQGMPMKLDLEAKGRNYVRSCNEYNVI